MSVRLYVGNLPKEPIDRDALAAMFTESGQDVTTKVIKDRKTGKCRGFAFVTVPTDEVADEFIEKYNGQSFMDSTLKIEKALPRSKTTKSKDEEASTEGRASTIAPKRKNKRTKKQSDRPQQSEGVQPDPRWADELAKLKEMLAAANN